MPAQVNTAVNHLPKLTRIGKQHFVILDFVEVCKLVSHSLSADSKKCTYTKCAIQENGWENKRRERESANVCKPSRRRLVDSLSSFLPLTFFLHSSREERKKPEKNPKEKVTEVYMDCFLKKEKYRSANLEHRSLMQRLLISRKFSSPLISPSARVVSPADKFTFRATCQQKTVFRNRPFARRVL
jgi:UDP-N-acetylglucosamine pyrophosphorylase